MASVEIARQTACAVTKRLHSGALSSACACPAATRNLSFSSALARPNLWHGLAQRTPGARLWGIPEENEEEDEAGDGSCRLVEGAPSSCVWSTPGPWP
eukprot:CAMPEP_0195122714 /NCGR_PEP_ID=MMETSP0448-20130528/127042_1 /TAXON_ID=66468 /ORGANISM="Heterocapsa triquestra, Strain CCMP 448" /LENGTH=97 /DNA_ID=CAMNT_0040160219 /DNA_START=392 /DNA_END=681 /DNA_ORIENTATION=+